MEPTVGRIVHFYIAARRPHSTGVDEGPYAAIITRVSPDGDDGSVLLKVLYPFGVDSVRCRHKEFAGDDSHYWVWPPRE
jgi:hypothetical protein